MERGTAPRLRFLCRPELVVVELVPPVAEKEPSGYDDLQKGDSPNGGRDGGVVEGTE